jgi:hypothetical protein
MAAFNCRQGYPTRANMCTVPARAERQVRAASSTPTLSQGKCAEDKGPYDSLQINMPRRFYRLPAKTSAVWLKNFVEFTRYRGTNSTWYYFNSWSICLRFIFLTHLQNTRYLILLLYLPHKQLLGILNPTRYCIS